MHIKEKVTGLWARRPRLSGTQGRALKGVAQFFAAMLVCTMIARGTAGATLAVVQTASPRRGELVQGLTADAALSAGEVQNVKAPAGLVLEKYFVPAGGRVEADTPLAQFDPDGVKDALARAKTELARLRLQREKLLAGDTADTSSLSSASTQRDRAQADYNAQKAQNDAAVAAARNDADTAQSALDAANAALAELRAQTDPPASEEALAAAQAAADAAAAALALSEFARAALSAVHLLNRRYMPYYKWAFRSARRLPLLSDVVTELDALFLPETDREALIETICSRVSGFLKKEGLSSARDTFLVAHAEEVTMRIKSAALRNMGIMVG